VTLTGWRGESALPRRPVRGSILSAYAGLRLAGVAAAASSRGADARLSAGALVSEVATPLELRGGPSPELVRCRDGWVVVRWRDEDERALLRALVGAATDCDRADVVEAARLARILAAPVAPPRRARTVRGLGAAVASGSLDGASAPQPRRVVDWSVLWAGPWATGQLRSAGLRVDRVEHPRRRDGLLGFAAGRRAWHALNGSKRTCLLDARSAAGRRRLECTVTAADILVTSMTPRALGSLGFDDTWRRERAPHLLHIELVAFEEPWTDAPGLGEHAAAQAGLLWRESGLRPADPHPWADPLLGAAALCLARAWQVSERRRGGRVRLSLERAAALALDQSGIE
jgi:hypothetical protein